MNLRLFAALYAFRHKLQGVCVNKKTLIIVHIPKFVYNLSVVFVSDVVLLHIFRSEKDRTTACRKPRNDPADLNEKMPLYEAAEGKCSEIV